MGLHHLLVMLSIGLSGRAVFGCKLIYYGESLSFSLVRYLVGLGESSQEGLEVEMLKVFVFVFR